MEKEIKVESLKISIGKKELNLTVEEAKKLKTALEDLFGKDVIHEHHHDWYYKYWNTATPYRPMWGEVLCSSNTKGVVGNLNGGGTISMSIK